MRAEDGRRILTSGDRTNIPDSDRRGVVNRCDVIPSESLAGWKRLRRNVVEPMGGGVGPSDIEELDARVAETSDSDSNQSSIVLPVVSTDCDES